MAAHGAAAEHDDSYSSNVSTNHGPGTGRLRINFIRSGFLCPTVVLDSSGHIFAYCVDPASKHSSLRMLAPRSLEVLASLEMPPSGRLGGFYMYMDQYDRVVVGAGDNHLLRVAHDQAGGGWNLHIVNNWNLDQQVTGHCGSKNCDYLESVTPDWTGRIWFSSASGVVGSVNANNGEVHATTLPKGENIANSISSSPAGVAVASDHALYLFDSQADGTPLLKWRETYDRGTRIKPGQLSFGTGATPVFFGGNGYQYLAITDNADVQEHLLVYRVADGAGVGKNRLLCAVPLFRPGLSGNENAPIGIGNSIVVANTYGYDYTDYVGRALKPLPGGMTRIDARSDDSGCDIVWTNSLPSGAVPKLSQADGYIYTVERTLTDSRLRYFFVAIAFDTGRTVSEELIGDSYAMDSFQLPGMIGPHDDYYQPTISGIVQVENKLTH